MMESRWRTGWIVMVVCFCEVVAAPVSRNRRIPFTDNTLKYLMNFGYLPASDMETGNLRSEDQLKEAIRNLQAFARIPVTGMVDAATQRLMVRRRCGRPDVEDSDTKRRKRFAIHTGPRWDHTDLTWSLRTYHVELDHGQVRKEMHQALAVWAQDSNLTFREINSDDADILVKFHRGEHGDGYAFDGPGRILAHAFFPGEERGGDVHFDEEENWLLDYQAGENTEGTRLFMVAVHEFGHSLGLSHSSDPTSLMFPWYQTLSTGSTFVLPDDDRRGIQQLYGVKNRWAKIPTYNPGDGRQPWIPSHRPTTTTSTAATTPARVIPTSRTTSTTTTHRPHHRHHRPSTPHPSKPDTCDTSYDAVSVLRKETFFFKGEYMWRIGKDGLMVGYPAPIIHLWKELPRNLTHVDAVYERLDKKIVFFLGREMYVFDGNRLEPGYPRPISSLGLSPEIDHIDAAMVWGYNSKTYFYSGNIYWRFDEEEKHIELDYPREITTMWKGMGSHFDAAFQWRDGKTYFFKGKGFWRLNDLRMRAESEQPIPSAAFWFNCSNFDLDVNPTKKPKWHKKWPKEENSALSSSASTVNFNFCLCALVFFYHLMPR